MKCVTRKKDEVYTCFTTRKVQGHLKIDDCRITGAFWCPDYVGVTRYDGFFVLASVMDVLQLIMSKKSIKAVGFLFLSSNKMFS